MQAIDKTDGKDQLWPELVRLIFLHFIKQQPELESDLKDLCKLLANCKTPSFSADFTYKQKTAILMNLISLTHDLDTFRHHLNERSDEKTGFNKQKQDFLSDIRNLEREKEDIVKKNVENDFIK